MCNRYSQSKRETQVATAAFAQQTFVLEVAYNIAPTQFASVVLAEGGKLVERKMIWGWKSNHGPLTNARAETAHEKLFRDAWRAGRCLVPADGVYEWKQMPDGNQPFRFVRDDLDLLWFAGLLNKGNFTIITAPATGSVAPFHDRLPIIIGNEEIDWGLTSGPATGADLIGRCVSTGRLEAYPVSRRMNSARYTEPDCIEPIPLPPPQPELWEFPPRP
jgi:putative SOS response-associated peptidase YedK